MSGEQGIGIKQLRWLGEHTDRLLATDAESQLPQLSREQRALLTGQRSLRERSKNRFPDPQRWLWSDRSLSQASDWLSAAFKSDYFAPQAGVVDACCGAGVDSVALAQRGCQVTSIDADPEMALLTELNAKLHGLTVATVAQPLSAELMRRLSAEHGGLHIDPDRRPGERRTLKADAFSPPIDEVLDYCQLFPTVVVKLAPSTQFTESEEARILRDYRQVWLASRGECRQQLLVRGSQAPDAAASRQAVLLDASAVDGFRSQIFSPCIGSEDNIDIAESIGRYVYDLHAVLHASRLQTAWGTANGLSAVHDPSGYYTSNGLIDDGDWCQRFEVIDILPWDDRQVRRWLRSQGAGCVEVKCRQVKVDANACQRRYSREGGEPRTLLVTRLDGRVRAIAAKRL